MQFVIGKPTGLAGRSSPARGRRWKTSRRPTGGILNLVVDFEPGGSPTTILDFVGGGVGRRVASTTYSKAVPRDSEPPDGVLCPGVRGLMNGLWLSRLEQTLSSKAFLRFGSGSVAYGRWYAALGSLVRSLTPLVHGAYLLQCSWTSCSLNVILGDVANSEQL